MSEQQTATIVGGGNPGAVVEHQSAPQPGSAAQDADAFAALGAQLNAPQPAAQQQSAPAVSTAELKAKALDFIRTNAAAMIDAKSRGDTRALNQYREILDFAHRDGAPVPAFLQHQTQGNRAAPADGELSAEYTPVNGEGARHLADRLNVQFGHIAGRSSDDGAAIGEVAHAMGVQQDVAMALGKEYLTHLSAVEADGVSMELHSSEINEFAMEASRLMGGQDKFVAASETARAVLERMPSPMPKYANALAWAEARGLTKSTMAFNPRTLNMLAAHGRAKGWIK